jgi:hypothetical protein
MKTFIIFIIVLFIVSCTPKNILSYKNRSFYKETDSYHHHTYTNTIILRQAIFYDRPMSNDEEYGFGVTYLIKEMALATGKRKFDLTSDTASVHYFHQLPKLSIFESQAYKLVGQIEILKWDSLSIRMKQNVNVIDSSQTVVKRYQGSRQFNRGTKSLKTYFNE